MSAADPLLVTLRCEGAGWRYCEELRKRHFPASRNIVPAHIMLFHHLPGDELDAIALQAGDIARMTPRFSPRVSAVRFLGRGTALTVDSAELLAFHRALSAIWQRLANSAGSGALLSTRYDSKQSDRRTGAKSGRELAGRVCAIFDRVPRTRHLALPQWAVGTHCVSGIRWPKLVLVDLMTNRRRTLQELRCGNHRQILRLLR